MAVGLLTLLFSTLGFALFGVIARELMPTVPLFQQLYLRNSFAILFLLLLYAKHIKRSWLYSIKLVDIKVFIWRGALCWLVAIPAFNYACTQTSLATVGFFVALPFTQLWSALLFSEKLGTKGIILSLLSASGAVLVALSQSDGGGLEFAGIGTWCALLSSAVYPLVLVGVRYQTPMDQKLLALAFLVVTLPLQILGSIVMREGMPNLSSFSAESISLTVAGGLLGALTTMSANFSFQRLSGMAAGIGLNTQVLWAIILGFLIYRELPTSMAAIGGLLIVASTMALIIHRHRTYAISSGSCSN